MKTKHLSRLLAFALLLLASTLAPSAQETQTAKSYDPTQSAAELRRAVEGAGQKDADAWFRLGVAADAEGDHAAALKAFRQAAKLRPGFALAHAGAAYVLYVQGKFKDAEKEAVKASAARRTSDDMIALSVVAIVRTGRQRTEAARELARAESEVVKKPDDARWHLRRAVALLAAPSGTEGKPAPFRTYFAERVATSIGPGAPPDEATRRASQEATRKVYAEAAESFDNYLRLKPNADDRAFVQQQLEALRFYTSDDARPGVKVFLTSDVRTKAVIVSKPDPGFTEAARLHNVTGVVRLRAVFDADGTVKHILVVRGLPHGLSERSVAAARQIKFRPAVRDGQPVSQTITLEYNFNIY